MSTAIGIREARLNLSKLVRRVREGGEIVITDHGRAVVKLVPIQPEDLSRDERVDRLRRRGVIGEKASTAPTRVPVPLGHGGEDAQRCLREDRDHDR